MSPTALTVVYDAGCAFCRRCRDWLAAQPTHVPLRFEAAGGRPGELVVVADDGRAWTGPAAFVMCLWATTAYRPVSYRLRGRAGEAFFRAVSAERHALGAMLGAHGER